MMRLILLSLLFLLTLQIEAQIISTYPKENPALQARTQEVTKSRNSIRMDLPFFDDFSYSGPYPVATHWEDQQVYINNTWANNLVSVGIATFDGLDASGSPYGGGRVGSSDTLTSVPLNLGGLSSAYISYYVQPRGLGDLPEPGSDLVLEFKTEDGEWIEMNRHIAGDIARDSVTQFEFIDPTAINESQFLYNGFQFRFRNFSLRNGAVDLWHLDYVRVDATPNTQIIQDLAFTKLPPSIFKNYTSVPLTHFNDPSLVEAELRSVLPVELYNHTTQSITAEDSKLRLRYVTNTVEVRAFIPPTLFDDPTFSAGRQSAEQSIRRDYLDRLERQRIDPTEKFQAKMIYEMTPSPQVNITEVFRNDSVASITNVSDYYAYDDGTAESAITIGGLSGSAAMQFQNYKADSLRGFQIQIPRVVAGAASGSITLKVWLEDLSSEPIIELPISPFFVDEIRDTLQAFTTYAIKEETTGAAAAVYLPPGIFYVGFEQGNCNSNCVPIGIDKNTPSAAERVYLNEDGNWRQVAATPFYSHLAGALMLRPILGTTTPTESEAITSTEELPVKELLQVFPNPTKEVVNIQLFDGDYDTYQLSIYNALGQQLETATLRPVVSLADYPTGVYFLRFTNLNTQEVGGYRLMVE